MNDLLRSSLRSSQSYLDLKRDVLRDLEAGPEMELGSLETEKNLEHFFDEVEQINIGMEKIQQLLSKLQDANEESRGIYKALAMKAIRDRMDKDVLEVLRLAKSIKDRLEELDKANIVNRKIPGCEQGTPADRTRMSITMSLRMKLKDLMGDFQALRQKMMGEYRETVERRYFTVTGHQADEETIEKIIETGESEVFVQRAIQDQGRGQVLETIREIQERHDAVKEIEKNLLELHQIFLDMAVLVEAQGEQLNDIERHMSMAANYVDKGNSQLHYAKQHQRSSRKCTLIAIILLLVVLMVVVIPVVTSFKSA
ncbi:hypothetical protein SELMODRAFT_134103 [Selaginella moellendorffii]|uniref:t-SNARE coiled-coil homology domain-containing protein n=1 Tax=Selaginella moellendorffii TaxID=88036 RepID=D8T822_SELML|nr:syntaxin-125 [Selaginella moellendorffii]EFJ07139.1 hypothetical protein SELMODRAFT_134103 [Selaginella moellendorffii]|eukprot:XP_002991735.1 syntaxin-125 [Selaginella moellendorffii]